MSNRQLKDFLTNVSLQKRNFHHALLSLEEYHLRYFQTLHPESETTKIYERRVKLARQDCDKAVKEHEALKHLIPKRLRGTVVTRTEERNMVVAAITEALQTTIETYAAMVPPEQDMVDLADLQTKAILETLIKIGLDTETLRKLNSQEALVLPVTHYQHYKGRHYAVAAEGIHTETEEKLVFYFDFLKRSWFGRPKEMFYGKREDNITPRFTLMTLVRFLTGRSA